MPRFGRLVRDRSSNVWLTWAIIAALAAGSVWNLATGDLLWAVFDAAVVAVALAPIVLTRDGEMLVSWRVLLIAAVPVLARTVEVLVEPATYLAVATLALLVTVEIDTFSEAEMPPWFAMTFVVLTTLTVSGVWAVVQFVSDVWLGTQFLTDLDDLMFDLVIATVVGVAAGAAFQFFVRRDPSTRRGQRGEATE